MDQLYRVIVDVQDDTTLDNVNNGIQDKKTLMIYYSPYCFWCQKMKPEIFKLDKALRKYKLNGQIVSVPPNFIPKIKGDNLVLGFPTLTLLDIGGEKKIEYNGNRTSNELLAFLEQNGVIQKRKTKKRKTQKRKRKARRSTKRR